MAVDYSDTGQFNVLGTIINAIRWAGATTKDSAYNQRVPFSDRTSGSYYETITQAFDSANLESSIGNLDGTFDAVASTTSGNISSLRGYMDQVLTHPDFLIKHLPITNDPSPTGVLKALIRDMVENSETVEDSIQSLGTAAHQQSTNGSGNVGSLLSDATLDGYNIPIQGGFAHPDYNLVASQLVVNDDIIVECISDSESGGSAEGGEQWQLKGTPFRDVYNPRYISGGANGEGAGVGPTITTANTNNKISNGEFETWSGTPVAPSNWTIDSGTAATDFIQETGASNVHRGTSSIKAVSGLTWKLSQELSPSSFNRRARYVLCAWIKASGVLSTGSITAKLLDGAGVLTDSTLTYDSTNDSTSFALISVAFNFPAEFTASTVTFELEATATTDADVYIDGLVLVPVTWFAGQNYVMVAGASKFIKGDRFIVPNPTESTTGKFQRFFGEFYKCQLPQDVSATIPDTLIA